MKTLAIICAAIIAPFAFSNCASYAKGAKPPEAKPYLEGFDTEKKKEQVGYWDGDGVQGSAKIKINLDQQKAFFYKGNQLVGQTPISSGSETHKTPKGRYKVTEKDIDHTSSLYGQIIDVATGEVVIADASTRKHKAKAGQKFIHAPMLNFMRFNGAIGMHTGHLPGYPASHGCVRLPDHMAKIFYENASYGTPIIVE